MAQTSCSRASNFGAPVTILLSFSLLGVVLSQETTPAKNEAPSFREDVRPILSDKCFPCHGPDAAQRKANLRLDQKENALASKAIVPGQPDQSLLIGRIESDSPSRMMPPPNSHLQLTSDEKRTLRQWIAAGAPYQGHWSFEELPSTVQVPSTDSEWPRHEIDRFILNVLQEHQLEPAPEADPGRWLRRVTFDLTGLPPTPEAVLEFVANPSPKAYEDAVDRLLSSEAYGERMATPWLDLARYADSYGYQSDQLSPTWPYRDWVIRAFNKNLPYDEFLRDQLAGDLLPQATREQRLATAFNRLHRMTNEGGSIEEEWLNEYAGRSSEHVGLDSSRAYHGMRPLPRPQV